MASHNSVLMLRDGALPGGPSGLPGSPDPGEGHTRWRSSLTFSLSSTSPGWLLARGPERAPLPGRERERSGQPIDRVTGPLFPPPPLPTLIVNDWNEAPNSRPGDCPAQSHPTCEGGWRPAGRLRREGGGGDGPAPGAPRRPFSEGGTWRGPACCIGPAGAGG